MNQFSNNMNIKELEKFVKPYLDKKDLMHGLDHVKRILKITDSFIKKYQKADEKVIVYGAYFHSIIKTYKDKIVEFLAKQGFIKEEIDQIVQAALDSDKYAKARTIEGKILHDAHLLEGGKTFWIIKCLVTGTARGQNFSEIIDYIRKNLSPKFKGTFKCYLPEAQKIYKEKEKFAIDFVKEMKDI